jgi:outer membrane lipoprotein-sorting protein
MSYIYRSLSTLLLLASVPISQSFANVNRRPGPDTDPYKGVLENARAKYASLKAYSDTGTITTEYSSGPSDTTQTEHYTFTTFYRAPRQFIFDFKKGPNVDDERLVVWADGGDFNTWWSATKVHEIYPKGQGDTAFALSSFPTKESVMKIPPLLFSGAGLHGAITDFKLIRSDPIETINGHRCYKLVGEVALAYGTGAVTESRPTTIWIDADSQLVRKVLEDTSKNGAIDRVTTTFEPEADPKIDDAKFKFVSPASN